MFPQRIDQILENYSLTTKRNAANFIRGNSIFVNGIKVTERKHLADSDRDEISVNGNILPKTKNLYILMNKPLGTVCSTVSDSHKTVFDFISPEHKSSPNCGPLHTVGRLDAETTGLLLLTTNGAFSHNLTSPETHQEKTYEITLETPVSSQQQKSWIHRCKTGILLAPEKKAPEYFTSPAELSFHTAETCTLTIHEGKFHQVRRTILALENKVISLHRTKIGPYTLPENFLPGQYILL